jgi:hypothetical protein
MSTTPASPITPISTQLSWLQNYERIVIVALVLLAGSWGLNHFLNNAAAKAETRANVAEQALATQKTADAQNAATVAQVTQQYAAIVQTLQAQNASLAQAVASRQASLVVQQKADATLALPDLANRLKTLGNAPDGSISVSGGQVVLTQPAAVTVTTTLEQVPVLQADVKDDQIAIGNYEKELGEADTLYKAQTTEITGLNLTITDQAKACTAQVAAVKAESRKKQMSWFKRGFGLGFIAGFFAGHSSL